LSIYNQKFLSMQGSVGLSSLVPASLAIRYAEAAFNEGLYLPVGGLRMGEAWQGIAAAAQMTATKEARTQVKHCGEFW
jgi:hypothetical protein